ncbi:MAG: polyprenyl synthetase [Ignavibacteria bacterium]|nr:MAG: polyprenyl synthetase [Ignavibacteria bacterium]KAF0159694.1 MAG: polyprenyl synthetase [Ignavibacteria bacterium]
MPKRNISDISQLIDDDLKRFNELFKQSLKSKVALVDLITRYILKQKGKKVRPLLVLLASKISGGVTERSYRGAILVELLHTATLVHDDVVDNAETRRSFPSINAVWKNKVAVLMGDYLLAKGLMKAVDGSDYDFLKVITNTVKRMSEGELLQTSKTRKLDNDQETYFRIISDKTASLLSTCCEIGARASTNDESKIAAMREYGENLGIAFQIRDDILDYVGTSTLLGKPLGADIKEKKITLPLIYALKNSKADEAKKIIKNLKSGEKKIDVNLIIEFTKNNGGIEYAEKIAKEYSNKAIQNLSIFIESEYKSALQDLAVFVVERTK